MAARKRTTKELQSQAAFGPKWGLGKVDPKAPGTRLANYPVKHERGLKRALAVGLAVDAPYGRGMTIDAITKAQIKAEAGAAFERGVIGGARPAVKKAYKKLRQLKEKK